MVPTGKALTCCKYSLPVCKKFFHTRKEYAICRLPHQIETYSLELLEGLLMQYPIEIKLKLNLLCDFRGNRKIASKIDPVTLYKHRITIIFLEFPVTSD